jgi:signal transduction histidine kinase
MTSPDFPRTSKQTDRRSSADRRSPGDIETLLREVELARAHFRDAIERNADAQMIIDAEGLVLFANKAAAELFGRDREAIVGTPFGFPITVGETTEVDVNRAGVPRVAEMRVMSTQWNGLPAYIASLRDVTERKQAEHTARRLIEERGARLAAEHAARRVQFLLDSTMLLASSLDYEQTLIRLARLCAEHLADWTVVYGIGEDGAPRRIHIAHRDRAKDAIADELCRIPIAAAGVHPVLELLRERKTRIVHDVTEEMLQRMSDNPRELELARSLGVSSFLSVPIMARGQPLGAITLVCADPGRSFTDTDATLARDIATRAALAIDNALLYRQAQDANKRRSDFLAVVSHDLRTPLTAIIGYADLMLMGIPEPLVEHVGTRVSRIRTSANHLMYLLNELLAFARLESGRQEPHLVETDVRDVVRDAAKVAEPLAAARGLELAVALPERAVTARTDPNMLRQVLLNLLGNAVKYTNAGRVVVQLHAPVGSRVRFSVSDTGEGIAPENLSRIFEPFWQVDPTRRSHGGGTGLGLSVVKHLVTLLQGEITVESTPAVGSVFHVSLPVSATP